jgi:hypothetical protein
MMKPFRFYTRLNLVELLGRRAVNVAQLLAGLREVPGTSIYYHTHRFLQQHQYLSPEPPNDFAFWVTSALNLADLGEGLASVDIIKFRSIRGLRERFIEIAESFGANGDARTKECSEGEEFHFMSCRTFILPTPYEARTLKEFRDTLGRVGISSIYYHVIEARLRLEKEENDFSDWLETIGEGALGREISRSDPYTITLEGLRRNIIMKVSRYVKD